MFSHPSARPALRSWPSRVRRRFALAVAITTAVVVLAGCADFSAESPTFTVQPSLTAPQANPSVPAPSSSTPSPSPSTSGQSTAQSSAPADPCKPTDPAVIAACLDAPWGLVVLPDGQSALVGERTTGRVLSIAPKTEPVEFAELTGLDTTGGGGLLGLALSPSYGEDGLVYAFVTTRTDARIVRFGKDVQPKAVFTGIPKGSTHLGGRIAFGSDGLLYVGTGDGGNNVVAARKDSLTGKILRLDEFGKPAKQNKSKTAVYASGLTDPSGMCTLADGRIAALDHRSSADVLLPLSEGANYGTLASSDALWTWKHAQGGAADCAVGDTQLANTSLTNQQLVGVTMSAQGSFTGSPQVLLDKKYGRLLTVTVGGSGEDQLFWMTTSNKDGKGKPVPADDRVIVLPAGGGGGEGGPD